MAENPKQQHSCLPIACRKLGRNCGSSSVTAALSSLAIEKRPQAERPHCAITEDWIDDQIFPDCQRKHQHHGYRDIGKQTKAPDPGHHHHCSAKTSINLERLKLFSLACRFAPFGCSRQLIYERLTDQRRPDKRQPDYTGYKLFAQLKESNSTSAD